MEDKNLMFYSREDNKFFNSTDEYETFRVKKAEEKHKQEERLQKEKAAQAKMKEESEARFQAILEKTSVVEQHEAELNNMILAYQKDYRNHIGTSYVLYWPYLYK